MALLFQSYQLLPFLQACSEMENGEWRMENGEWRMENEKTTNLSMPEIG
ncbi:hypothetical protein [Aquirufa nivalisilvae]|nr:hypothetical protein [Aquirufa nivalisilvae]